jgi:hypothetical protein
MMGGGRCPDAGTDCAHEMFQMIDRASLCTAAVLVKALVIHAFDQSSSEPYPHEKLLLLLVYNA